MLKTCVKCKQTLPLSDFYKHIRMADGHDSRCKTCAKIDVRKYKLKRADYYRAYKCQHNMRPEQIQARAEYNKTDAGKSSARKTAVAWQSKHPSRRKAHGVLYKAVKSGKVTKFPCWVCGVCNVDGHHPDYSRPLEVVWLCRKHHQETHAMAAST